MYRDRSNLTNTWNDQTSKYCLDRPPSTYTGPVKLRIVSDNIGQEDHLGMRLTYSVQDAAGEG